MAHKFTMFGSQGTYKSGGLATAAASTKADVVQTTAGNFRIYSGVLYSYTQTGFGLVGWEERVEVEIPRVCRAILRTRTSYDIPSNVEDHGISSLWLAKSVQKTFLSGQDMSDIGNVAFYFDPANAVTKFEQTDANNSSDSNSPNGRGVLTLGIDLGAEFVIRLNATLGGNIGAANGASISLSNAAGTAMYIANGGVGSIGITCPCKIELV